MTRHFTVAVTEAQAAILESNAARSDVSVEAEIGRLIQQAVDYDTWFRAEVQKGVDAADRGELVPHDEVVSRMAALRSELLARKSAE